jgi:hypothetical protein
MDSINAVASDLIEADGAEEAPRVARRPHKTCLPFHRRTSASLKTRLTSSTR